MVAAALLLAGCSDSAAGLSFDDDDDGTARGQTIIFVGTDPQTLQTDLYAVQALALYDDEEPDLATAAGWALSSLADLSVGSVTSPLLDATDSLFAEDLPFAVPDRSGSLLAVPASVRDPESGDVVAGRIALLDLSYTDPPIVSDPVAGLRDVSFTWDAEWLVYEREVPDSAGRTEVLVQRPIGVGFSEPIQVGPSAEGTTVEVAGLQRDGDRILLLERNLDTGSTDVWRVDPETGTSELLTGGEDLQDRVDQPVLSPDGRWLAMVRSAPDSPRAVIVLDLDLAEPPVIMLTDDTSKDCFWPSWSPDSEAPSRLAFVCSDVQTEQPDLLRWDPDSELEPVSLTGGPQPYIGGTMDGLVIRTEPRWDPAGDVVVFGASTPEEALSGSGMTLLVVPVEPPEGDPLVFPIWTGDEASAGWAHFSAASPVSPDGNSGPMLLWDRDQSGIQDTVGNHPIQILPTDNANPDAQPVELGTNLLVSYPLFLGTNTMLYP